MGVVAADLNEGLGFLVELIDAGTVVTVIDRRFTLRGTAGALGYFQEGLFSSSRCERNHSGSRLAAGQERT
jgi:hypothetical protein